MTFRFGIIGWNDTAFRTAQAISAAGNAELAAVMSADAAQRRELADLISARLIDDLCDLLADPEVDAVYIAPPAGEREGLVQRAVAAGKPVLMDEPLAPRLDDAVALLDACGAPNCAIGLTAPWAVDAALQATRLLLRARLFGDLAAWRAELVSSGRGQDPLLAALPALDQFRFLTGLEAEQVYAQQVTRDEGLLITTLLVSYANGCLGTLQLGSGVPGAEPRPMRLFGPLGQLELADEPRAYRTRSTEDAPANTWHAVRYAGPRGSREQAVAQFVARIEAQEPPPMPASGALASLHILKAARQSLAEFRPVTL